MISLSLLLQVEHHLTKTSLTSLLGLLVGNVFDVLVRVVREDIVTPRRLFSFTNCTLFAAAALYLQSFCRGDLFSARYMTESKLKRVEQIDEMLKIL